MGLVVIWPNKFLSGEFRVFRSKVVIIWSPVVLAAIGMNKFLSGEFRVFRGKWSLVALGVTMEILMVIQNVLG